MRAFLLSLAMTVGCAGAAAAQTLSPERQAFRTIYEELVEIDSSPTTGSCTRAAEAMLVHLRAAGYSEADARVIVPDGAPEDGNDTAGSAVAPFLEAALTTLTAGRPAGRPTRGARCRSTTC